MNGILGSLGIAFLGMGSLDMGSLALSVHLAYMFFLVCDGYAMGMGYGLCGHEI